MNLRLPNLVGIFAACAAVAVALPAGAQDLERVQENNGDGMDMHLFRAPVDSKGFLSVNGADILGANDISLGLVLDYGHNMMPLNPNHSADVLLEHAFQGTFQFNYGIAHLLVIGISAPVILNGGTSVRDIGPTGATYDDDDLDGQALGHVALHAKFRILRPDGESPIGLAILGQAGIATGGARDYATEPGFWYWPQAIIEKRFGSTGAFRLGLNAGFRGHTGENPEYGLGADGNPQLEHGELKYGNLLTAGFGIGFRVLQPLELNAETYLPYLLADAASDQKLSAEAIGGFKLFIERNSFLMIGGGLGYTPGFQSPDQRAVLGFIFEPSIGDRDGDGIKDDEDDCPDDPEDFDGFQDTRTDSPPGKYGCPDPDNDEDGILDKDDRCPNNPEDRDGDHDEDGCPEGSDGDRDGDGILDSRDKCPDVPEDRDGFEDKDGCPDPDNDKDGIPDVSDKCPNNPEDKDGVEDEDGCPEPDDKGKVIIQGSDILILEKIQFKTASAEILPESNGILDAVATTLNAHPEFKLIEVQGHADERAADDYNLRLTKDRANAVVKALGARKVEAGRLRAMGYGEYCPLDPASNDAAWEKNRRVEFKVVRTDKGPTDVELGCEKAREKGVKPPPP